MNCFLLLEIARQLQLEIVQQLLNQGPSKYGRRGRTNPAYHKKIFSGPWVGRGRIRANQGHETRGSTSVFRLDRLLKNLLTNGCEKLGTLSTSGIIKPRKEGYIASPVMEWQFSGFFVRGTQQPPHNGSSHLSLVPYGSKQSCFLGKGCTCIGDAIVSHGPQVPSSSYISVYCQMEGRHGSQMNLQHRGCLAHRFKMDTAEYLIQEIFFTTFPVSKLVYNIRKKHTIFE